MQSSIHHSCALFGACLALFAFPAPAQNPDILVPSGSLDGIYRLVDRNQDGDYNDDGEAYDYVLHMKNTSVRNIELVTIGGSKRLYYVSSISEQVYSAWDSNGDGVIDLASEETLMLDCKNYWGDSGVEVNRLVHTKNGVFYMTNDGGNFEGIWRLEDLSGDGDFNDANEVLPALVEPTVLVVNNAPLSGNPVLAVTAFDSLEYDPSWGVDGRFLIEDENFDFTLALEDKNGDGDFDDAGEGYLFSALWTGTVSLSLIKDVNPDVTAGIIPISNEIREHLVDTSTVPATYYFLSLDTNSANLDAAMIYRGQDLNQDGDVNDAGELRIFWDGSLDSTGANPEYNFTVSLSMHKGALYVAAEFDAATDQEHIVILDDKNKDGDANDPGELSVVWNLGTDKAHYDNLILDAGVLPAAPSGLPATYDYAGDASCATSKPGFLNMQIGSTNFDDKPMIGNANHMVRCWGAIANGNGVYNVGIVTMPGGPFSLNPPSNTCNIYVLPLASISFTTDAAGARNTPMPIPNDPNLVGLTLYWQNAVLDPLGGAIPVTTSDYAWVRYGSTYSFSKH